MYSSATLFDFDKNSNGRLDPPETENLKKGALSNLSKHEFFTHIKINGKEFKVKHVTGFSAKKVDEKLVYNFFVPCHVKATNSSKKLSLAVYDSTFYSSIDLTRINPIALENHQMYETKYKIMTNKKNAFYFGQIYPREIKLEFKRKDG